MKENMGIYETMAGTTSAIDIKHSETIVRNSIVYDVMFEIM